MNSLEKTLPFFFHSLSLFLSLFAFFIFCFFFSSSLHLSHFFLTHFCWCFHCFRSQALSFFPSNTVFNFVEFCTFFGQWSFSFPSLLLLAQNCSPVISSSGKEETKRERKEGGGGGKCWLILNCPEIVAFSFFSFALFEFHSFIEFYYFFILHKMFSFISFLCLRPQNLMLFHTFLNEI